MKQTVDIQSFSPIFTIGHGSKTIGEFTHLLTLNKIELLVDVRSSPYSRFHPQYRQTYLMERLSCIGIKYLWLGKELGGRPSDPNLYRNGKVDYAAIKNTDLFKEGIQQLLKFATANIKVTLMCSESDPNDCHRKHLIADELARLGVIVLHIDKTGKFEKHHNVLSIFG